MCESSVLAPIKLQTKSISEQYQINAILITVICLLYYKQMGANQQKLCSLSIAIQKNPKLSQQQLFDFTKQGLMLNSTTILFPSYLHYYEQPKIVTFSLLQDHRNVFAKLDYHKNIDNILYLTKVNQSLCGKIWKLLSEGEQVQLSQGSFVRLGRIELQVKEIKLINNKRSMRSLIIDIQEDLPKPNHLLYLKSSNSRFAHSRMKESDVISLAPSDQILKRSIFTQRSSQQICRFCFDGSSTKRNPLFCVCLCAGSVKNIHYQCLRSWVKSKMGTLQTSHCIYYHYEPMICQLCKYVIKNDIMYQGRIYKLFEPQQIHPPYARFEYSENNKIFEILVRLQESTNIQVGRGVQNDLNLNDATINRSHCSLFYTSRRLFLKGNNSKYGTFVQLSQTMQIKRNHPLKLLIQNNLISISRNQAQKNIANPCCSVESSFRIKVK